MNKNLVAGQPNFLFLSDRVGILEPRPLDTDHGLPQKKEPVHFTAARSPLITAAGKTAARQLPFFLTSTTTTRYYYYQPPPMRATAAVKHTTSSSKRKCDAAGDLPAPNPTALLAARAHKKARFENGGSPVRGSSSESSLASIGERHSKALSATVADRSALVLDASLDMGERVALLNATRAEVDASVAALVTAPQLALNRMRLDLTNQLEQEFAAAARAFAAQMESLIDAQSGLIARSTDYIVQQCPVCLDHLVTSSEVLAGALDAAVPNPILLSVSLACRHPLCEPCGRVLTKRVQGRTTITCPVCRENTVTNPPPPPAPTRAIPDLNDSEDDSDDVIEMDVPAAVGIGPEDFILNWPQQM